MVISLLPLLGLVTAAICAAYAHYQRRKLEQLLASDDIAIWIYLEPDAEHAHHLDVYSREVLERKKNAQWN